MPPEDLLWMADRLVRCSDPVRVRIRKSGLVATLHPPGRNESDTKLLINAGTAARPRILAIKPEAVDLLPSPDPAPEPPKLDAPCVHCQAPATLRCTVCKAPLCGAECADRNAKRHRPACREVQAKDRGRCRAGTTTRR